MNVKLLRRHRHPDCRDRLPELRRERHLPRGGQQGHQDRPSRADQSHERNESVILTLSPRATYPVENPSTSRVIILNEDPMPRLR